MRLVFVHWFVAQIEHSRLVTRNRKGPQCHICSCVYRASCYKRSSHPPLHINTLNLRCTRVTDVGAVALGDVHMLDLKTLSCEYLLNIIGRYVSVAQGVHSGTLEFMPPKRRFWKELQKIKCAFSRVFSRVRVLDLGYEPLKVPRKIHLSSFVPSFQNRVGSCLTHRPSPLLQRDLEQGVGLPPAWRGLGGIVSCPHSTSLTSTQARRLGCSTPPRAVPNEPLYYLCNVNDGHSASYRSTEPTRERSHVPSGCRRGSSHAGAATARHSVRPCVDSSSLRATPGRRCERCVPLCPRTVRCTDI